MQRDLKIALDNYKTELKKLDEKRRKVYRGIHLLSAINSLSECDKVKISKVDFNRVETDILITGGIEPIRIRLDSESKFNELKSDIVKLIIARAKEIYEEDEL